MESTKLIFVSVADPPRKDERFLPTACADIVKLGFPRGKGWFPSKHNCLTVEDTLDLQNIDIIVAKERRNESLHFCPPFCSSLVAWPRAFAWRETRDHMTVCHNVGAQRVQESLLKLAFFSLSEVERMQTQCTLKQIWRLWIYWEARGRV